MSLRLWRWCCVALLALAVPLHGWGAVCTALALPTGSAADQAMGQTMAQMSAQPPCHTEAPPAPGDEPQPRCLACAAACSAPMAVPHVAPPLQPMVQADAPEVAQALSLPERRAERLDRPPRTLGA